MRKKTTMTGGSGIRDIRGRFMIKGHTLLLLLLWQYSFSNELLSPGGTIVRPKVTLEEESTRRSMTAFMYDDIISIISPYSHLGTVCIKTSTGSILYEEFCPGMFINIPISHISWDIHHKELLLSCN